MARKIEDVQPSGISGPVATTGSNRFAIKNYNKTKLKERQKPQARVMINYSKNNYTIKVSDRGHKLIENPNLSRMSGFMKSAQKCIQILSQSLSKTCALVERQEKRF